MPQFQWKMDELVTVENLFNAFPYLENTTIGGRNQIEHDRNMKQFLNALKKNLTLNEMKTISLVNEINNILGYCVENGQIKPDPERLLPLKELPVFHNSKSLKRALEIFAYYAGWVPNFSDVTKSRIIVSADWARTAKLQSTQRRYRNYSFIINRRRTAFCCWMRHVWCCCTGCIKSTRKSSCLHVQNSARNWTLLFGSWKRPLQWLKRCANGRTS